MKFIDSIKLAESWQAWCCDFSEGAEYREAGDAELYGFDLPMDTRHLMFTHGKCDDPRKEDNSRQSDWVVTKEWWFRKTFQLPTLLGGERVFMRCRGVDYLAEYFVNGVHVGGSESFNQEDYFDITGALGNGGQELAIRLWACPPEIINWEAFEKHDELAPLGLGKLVGRSQNILKARMFWGGDHSPFLMSCGVAMPPEIIIARDVLVRSIRTDYEFSDDYSTISGELVFELTAWGEADYEITLTPVNFEGESHTLAGTWTGGGQREAVPFSNLPVKAWFPFQQGFPHCYELRVRAGGQPASVTTGFRKIERRHNEAFKSSPAASVMDWHPYENNVRYGTTYYKGYDAIREAGEAWPEKPREGDYRYTHLVNGRELFVMGGSIVPPRLFFSDWNGEYFRRLIRRARESNNNTLRVWGGGYLCGEDFFEEADLQGVMISQDFLNFQRFTDKSLGHLLRREKEYRSILRQLNPHPSAVVMNGGNELLQTGNQLSDPIFQLMRRVMQQGTTNQYFHLSSPVNPEVHGPWRFNLDHAARYSNFRTIFCSECGVVACPSMKSMRKALTKEQIDDLFGEAWDHRQPMRQHIESLIRYVELFGPVDRTSATEAIERTQLVQAMSYQCIAEEFRRCKPEKSGFTTWEFNEPWLDFDWGILDAFLVPKHSFWTFKRACAPRLISARFESYVYAPGARVRAEIFFSVEGNEHDTIDARAAAYDSEGRALKTAEFSGSADSASVRLGEMEFDAPDEGAFFLKLTGRLSDGGEIDNDYCFFVLPAASREPIRVLFISGGCYENAVAHEFFRAAGFEIDERVVSPIEPLDMKTVDLARHDVVVLGPTFNPLTSLGRQFFPALRAAVEKGLGFVYCAYNTSAYTCGRYDVDQLSGSDLEELLPVGFAENHYQNSEDFEAGDAGLKKHRDHPIWNYITMASAPRMDCRVSVEIKDEKNVIGTDNGEPVLAAHKVGRGIVTSFTGPYGGHNYPGLAFRDWPYAHRLLENIIEYTATGAVQPRAFDPHVFQPLLEAPLCGPQVDIAETFASADRREWEITVINPGRVPVLYFDLGNDSEAEGEAFDWSVSDNRFCLFENESKRISASATARPGHTLPDDLQPVWSAWNG